MSHLIHESRILGGPSLCGIRHPGNNGTSPCPKCTNATQREATRGIRVNSLRARRPNAILRRMVLERDGSACRRCGHTHSAALQIDHIIPWAHGGLTVLANLQILCANCNAEKSATV